MTKEQARAAVKRAIDRGLLRRPDACSRCGATGSTSDGRAFIHAHHRAGYDRPLDVEWLCPKCHFIEDPRLSGEQQGMAKLTLIQVAEIRSRYKPGKGRYHYEGSAKRMAREYGVSDRTIRRIVRGEIWSAALQEKKG